MWLFLQMIEGRDLTISALSDVQSSFSVYLSDVSVIFGEKTGDFF